MTGGAAVSGPRPSRPLGEGWLCDMWQPLGRATWCCNADGRATGATGESDRCVRTNRSDTYERRQGVLAHYRYDNSG